MFKLKIKGIDDIIILDDRIGKEVKRIYEDRSVQEVHTISLPTLSCKKRDIVFIQMAGNLENKEFVSYLPTSEIKSKLGDFEVEYAKHDTGKLIQHPEFGIYRQGIIDWVISLGVITKKESEGKEYWSINYTKYPEFMEKHGLLNELIRRREKQQAI
jgi:hypothetical protein